MTQGHINSIFNQFIENSEFKSLMVSNQKHYKLPLQMSIYSDLNEIQNLNFLVKLPNDNKSNSVVFCFYGMILERYKKYQYKIFLTFIKVLEEELMKMKQRERENKCGIQGKGKQNRGGEKYSILFFNTYCDGYDSFVSFKNMIKRLPEKYFQKLDYIFVVHPQKSFSVVQWLSFGIINKFINKIMTNVKRIQELDQYGYESEQIYKNLPKQIIEYDLRISKQIQESKQNHKSKGKSKNKNLNNKNEKVSVIKQTKYIALEQYQLSKIGIPIYLRSLISYFELKPEKLKNEGLFRINGSIDDINQLSPQFMRKNFELLNTIQNPNTICSLIKIFFTSLKQPIFSYDNYDQILKIKYESNSVQYKNLVATILKNMPVLKYKILLIILGFLIYRVSNYQKYNKMNISNIAICMCPCFFRNKQYSNEDILNTPKFVTFLIHIMNEFPKYFSAKIEQGKIYRQQAQCCIKELRNIIPKKKKEYSSNNLQSKIPSKPNRNNFHMIEQS